jgi:hypothetical protein
MFTPVRKAAEDGSFYGVLSRSALRDCSGRDDAGKLVVDYHFADGGHLHVERDSRIEFTLYEARLGSARPIDAREILTRAEGAAFGADGCGIDWQRPEARTVPDEPGFTETIYRGDTCNCQARARRDRSGQVVALAFRSAC